MNAVALSDKMARFAGRIIDTDTHEMAPAQTWVDRFGEEVRQLADYYISANESEESNPNTPNIVNYEGDHRAIGGDINMLKGCRAPGSVDLARRVPVMDAMGVSRQLIFPSFVATVAMSLLKHRDNPSFMASITGDRRIRSRVLLDQYNDWAIESARISDRLRPVGILYGETAQELHDRAKQLIDSGLKAIWLYPAGELPAGLSPAHPDHDSLWALLAERNVALLLHLAGDGNFLREKGWNDAPAFAGHVQHVEISRDPYFLTTIHLPYENFLTVMVLGGVFDRHPALRFGVIECTAYWVGPLMRRLDLWHRSGSGKSAANLRTQEGAYRLPEPPSFYFKRNVRVTPFVFEDVARDIRDYDLADVLCFSTDYPHVEGGKNCFETFYDKLVPLGEEVLEKFFVTNGEFLLPA